MEALERVGRLLLEIHKNLQIIRMELLKEAPSEQIPQCVHDATQDIEKLLEEVRQHFLLPR